MIRKVSILLVVTLLLSCQDYGNLILLDQTPTSLKEMSGLQLIFDENGVLYFYAINDSGNKPVLYSYQRPNLVYDQRVVGVENTDWEDLAVSKDKKHLFIADTGNNNYDRKEFQIIKLDFPKSFNTTTNLQGAVYPFVYEDMGQKGNKSKVYYDCEAIIADAGTIYLFTKNRSKDFDGYSNVYSLNIERNDKIAKLLTRIYIGNQEDNSLVTGADLNEKGQIALLTHDKVVLIENWKSDFTKFRQKTYLLKHKSQKESIAFLNDSTVLIADERKKGTGGNMFCFELSDSFLDASKK